MRASSLGYGAALGLMVVAGIGTALALLHVSPNWLALAYVFALCLGLVPTLEAAIDLARLHNSDRLTERERAQTLAEREAKLYAASPVENTTAVVIRRIPGTVNGRPRELELEETRPARWCSWQAAAVRLLEWYTVRRSLLCEVLVDQERALASRADWVALTDELSRVGLVVKANGRPTLLAAPLPVVRDRIERGVVEWTLAADPPPLAAPHPAGGVVVEARTA